MLWQRILPVVLAQWLSTDAHSKQTEVSNIFIIGFLRGIVNLSEMVAAGICDALPMDMQKYRQSNRLATNRCLLYNLLCMNIFC